MSQDTALKIPRSRVEIGALAALFVLLFAPFMVSMVDAWNNRPDASHGWFIIPIAGYLIWKQRAQVRAQPEGSFSPAIAAVVVGLMAAVVSARADLESVGRIALVLTLNGLLLYLLGAARYRKIAFPALFLFLMIPVPITITGSVTFPLQILSSILSEHLISILGIPVNRMGNVLCLPSGNLEVAEACSGLRSMMTFVTLGVLLAWLTPTVWKKVLVSVLAVPFALLANVIRISATAILVDGWGPAAASGWIHEAVGIVSFLVGLVLYAVTAKFLGSKWVTE